MAVIYIYMYVYIQDILKASNVISKGNNNKGIIYYDLWQ